MNQVLFAPYAEKIIEDTFLFTGMDLAKIVWQGGNNAYMLPLSIANSFQIRNNELNISRGGIVIQS